MMENYKSKINIITLLLLVTMQSFSYAQNIECTKKIVYDNGFFELDFEKNSYTLEDFKNYFFTTFPHNDPTLGKVVYDSKQWNNDDIIINKPKDGIYSYVRKREDDRGFDSFRLTSKSYFNLTDSTQYILFVFKGTFPSEKGLWPAWWLNGSYQDEWIYSDSTKSRTDESLNRYSGKGEFYNTPSSVNCTDWPSGGEIDIIENINGEDKIHNTIHTCPQMCDSEWNDDGVIINCANSNESDPNPGCSGKNYEVNQKAGTFACLWENGLIKFYYWAPNSKVRDEGGPLSLNPNPIKWEDKNIKNKVKLFNSSMDCNSEKHSDWQCKNCDGIDECSFANIKMIFNTTVCGVWAGNKFDKSQTSFKNCEEFILGEGREKLDGSYFKIEYVAVRNIKL